MLIFLPYFIFLRFWIYALEGNIDCLDLPLERLGTFPFSTRSSENYWSHYPERLRLNTSGAMCISSSFQQLIWMSLNL